MEQKDELIERLTNLLTQFNKKMAQRVNENISSNVTVSQLYLLRHIDSGIETTGELAITLGITPPAVSKLVDQLYVSGYVIRIRSKEDRRVVQIKLTEQGKEVLHINIAIKKKIFKDVFSQLTNEDLNTFMMVMDKMNKTLE